MGTPPYGIDGRVFVQMSLKEMEARFRGYRRREEEREEARIMEHNRKVSDLFSSRRY